MNFGSEGWNELATVHNSFENRTNKNKNALKGPKVLPENHNPNLKVYYVANLFGEWDNCVWFEVDNHEHAMDFVQNKIATIPG